MSYTSPNTESHKPQTTTQGRVPTEQTLSTSQHQIVPQSVGFSIEWSAEVKYWSADLYIHVNTSHETVNSLVICQYFSDIMWLAINNRYYSSHNLYIVWFLCLCWYLQVYWMLVECSYVYVLWLLVLILHVLMW